MKSIIIWFSFLFFQFKLLNARCPGNPQECSLHGTCLLNHSGDQICKCQWGWDGYDCSKKLCPFGMDPLVNNKKYRIIRLISKALQGKMNGKLLLTFHGHTVEMDANSEIITSLECKKVFQRFQNIQEVECERLNTDSQRGGIYEIKIISFPMYPIMNNLYYHEGNPSISEFLCDTTYVNGVSGAECYFEEVEQYKKDYQGYYPCSNHGYCNHDKGICECVRGYYGDNCGNNQDDGDILTGISNGPFFTGNLVHVSSVRTPSSDFNILKANVEGIPILTIYGNGETILHQGSITQKKGNHILENGQLEIYNGKLDMDHSDIKMENGNVMITNVGTKSGAIHIESHSTLCESSVMYIEANCQEIEEGDRYSILKVTNKNLPLFDILDTGRTIISHGGLNIVESGVEITDGGLVISNGGQIIHDGGLMIEKGGILIEENGMTINTGGLTILDDGMTIRSNSSSGSVLNIHSMSDTSNDAIIKITGDNTILLQLHSFHEKRNVFEILSTGETIIYSGGLNISSGGLLIGAGGQKILSGGLDVQTGGVQIHNGGLEIYNDGFHIKKGNLHVEDNSINGIGLFIQEENEKFVGSVLKLSGSNHLNNHLFNYIEAINHYNNETIWALRGDGSAIFEGDISTKNNGKIVAAGDLIASTRSILNSIHILANDFINIPSTHSYVRIIDDGEKKNNYIIISIDGAIVGQILFIQNDDEQDCINIRIQRKTLAQFIFNGNKWMSVTATTFDTKIIKEVEILKAKNDIDIGLVTLSAENIKSTCQKEERISFYGPGGILSGNDAFIYKKEETKLFVPIIETGELNGRINATGSEFIDIKVIGGILNHVNLSATTIYSSGEMHIESSAYIGSGLTVNGQVMGSGAYVDSSDIRIKKNIIYLDNNTSSIDIIMRLRAAQYEYRSEEYPQMNLPINKTDIGFIAQDIEKVVPSVVSENKEGIKHVAYGRIVPIVVEAIKEQNIQLQELHNQIKYLKDRYNQMINEFDKIKNELKQLKQGTISI